MATTLRIDPDDELPVILEKLPAQSACVVVVPPHARALSSVVGAKLLARRAAARGTSVAVVTDDHAVGAHARAAGLAVASSVEEAYHLLPEANKAAEETIVMPQVTAPPVDGERAPAPSGSSERRGHAQPPQPDEQNGADGATRTGKTVRFVAGEADIVEPDPDEDEDDADRAAAIAAWEQAHGNGGATGVRGHSGGERAARRARPQPAPPDDDEPAQRPRPGWADTAGSAAGSVGRIVVPILLVAVLLGLLWLCVTILGGLLNPEVTLSVQMRPGTVSATTPPIHGILSLPPGKRTATRAWMGQAVQREEATWPVPVRGIQIVPDHVATGVIRLANLTPKPLVVPAGTPFTTAQNAQTFLTTVPITVPAAHITFTHADYGVASVPVKAAAGGTGGNVPARAIVNPPAQFSGALNVRNDSPTHGGTNRRERIVDPRDLGPVSASLFGALIQKAQQDIARRHGADVRARVLSVERSPVTVRMAPDHRSATVTQWVVVSVHYVHNDDLAPQAMSAIGRYPRVLPHSITWTPRWLGPDTFVVDVTGHTDTPLNADALRHALAGLSKEGATVYLHRRRDIAAFTLTLQPPWADHLPGDVTRIHVIQQQPQ